MNRTPVTHSTVYLTHVSATSNIKRATLDHPMKLHLKRAACDGDMEAADPISLADRVPCGSQSVLPCLS